MTSTRTLRKPTPRKSRCRDWLAQHSALATNAVSLYGSTIVTSALGFAFWWLAARAFAPIQVGSAAAVVSAMQLVAAFCLLGLNTLLVAELSGKEPRDARSLIFTATAVVFTVSALVSVLLSVVLSALNPRYDDLLGNPLAAAVFATGTAFTTATFLLDDACVGLLQGRIQLRRNAFFALAKLLLVPVAAFMIPTHHGLGLTSAWAIATVTSLWLLRPLARDGTGGRLLDLQLVRRYLSMAFLHHWLNVALQAPRLLLPVIAVALVGVGNTAAFFTAATLVGFFSIVAFHFATVLFALDPGDEARLTHEVRFTFSISSAVALASLPVLCLGASPLLRLFNPAYASAASALVVLAFTTWPMAFKYHYVAIARVRGQLARAAAITTLGSVLEVIAATVGGRLHGMSGIAFGLLAAQVLEALYFAVPIAGVLRGHADGRVSSWNRP